ncbi:MAG: hypothetical protein AUI33_04005 [Ignavibacteria bacterium 13_1_40CM_2_61_4]|nr:MAG: hypothetical protein AUI33_04005 [Ignavibacteria bacterium 13_1_40CM_2_61_4]
MKTFHIIVLQLLFILPGTVTQLTGTSVELWASITTNGSSTVAWFEWGKTPALGNATPQRGAIAPQPEFQIQGELLKDLELATTYYYRVVAMNEYGSNHDTVRSFTTLPGLRRPDLVTLEADSITETSVRMRARCKPNSSYTWAYFVWGVGGAAAFASGTPEQYVGSGTTDTVVTWILSGLVPNVTYHYRAFASFYANGFNTWHSGEAEQKTVTTRFDSASKGMSIPIKVTTIEGYTPVIRFGVHTFATSCIDSSLGEAGLPPTPPGFEIRFLGRCVELGIYYDYRRFVSPSQIDTYRVQISGGGSGYPLKLSWPNLKSIYQGSVLLSNIDTVVDMRQDTSLEISDPEVSSLRIIAQYPNPVAHFPDVVLAHLIDIPSRGTTFNSLINPNGLMTESWFEWGEGQSYDKSSPHRSLGEGQIVVPVAESLSPFSTAGIFRARAVARNVDGLVYGPELLFGSTGVMSDTPLVPVAFTLLQNYPNPFKRPTQGFQSPRANRANAHERRRRARHTLRDMGRKQQTLRIVLLPPYSRRVCADEKGSSAEVVWNNSRTAKPTREYYGPVIAKWEPVS